MEWLGAEIVAYNAPFYAPILEKLQAQESHDLIYGKYKGERMSTLEDFREAEYG